MNEAVVVSAREPLAPIWRKAIAVGAFLLSALFLYYIDNVPSAVDIDGHPPWKAARNHELILYGLPQEQVFEFNGAPGAGLDVRAPVVRPSAETLTALRDGGVAAPETKGTALSWLGRTDAAGKINLVVQNQRAAPEAGLSLVATGGANIPQLRLTPIETAVTITLASVAGDGLTMTPIGLRVGDTDVPQPLATIMPVKFELPPGESIILTFPSAAAMNDATFRLGVPVAADEFASDLKINWFAIGPRRTEPGQRALSRIEQAVCAAEAGKLLFTRLVPAWSECGEHGRVAVEELKVTPSDVAVDMAGSGFVVENGKTVTAGLLTKIGNNKLIAALLGIVYATLAGWVWKSLTGMGK